MPTTRSYTHTQTRAKDSRVTPTIEARRARGASSIPENPPFRHRYSNPSPVPPAPRRREVGTTKGRISEVFEEPNAEHPEPSDPGDDDGDGNPDPDPESSSLSGEDDPIPNPNPNAEADGEEQVGCRLIAALERLADNGRAERQGSRAKLREPDPFDGKDPKKLRGFLLQCTLNFCARPQDF
jgi:hypothetical protein